jgi:aspartyl-tRNA(Asn)/glutamyl-tRNA(Gln) amidotransferase subunit A
MQMEWKNATAIRDGVNNREISAVEVARQTLARIASADPELKAFLTVVPEQVEGRAAEVDRQVQASGPLPLAGVPVAVKDNICTRNLRTTASSRILENFVPPYSATAVERLERAGAVIIGKTNCDEFAMGSSTENSAYQVTRNPYDVSRVAGGSSGGSVAAVAAGMAALALGSETGGSVRQPSAFCGVLGLKPTYGRISRYGLIAFASSLDAIGPIARTPRDLALCLSVIAGLDPLDSTSSPALVAEYDLERSRPVAGLRLGVPREYFGAGLDPENPRMCCLSPTIPPNAIGSKSQFISLTETANIIATAPAQPEVMPSMPKRCGLTWTIFSESPIGA